VIYVKKFQQDVNKVLKYKLFLNFDTHKENLIKLIIKWNELKVDFGSYGFIYQMDDDDFWGDNKILLKAGDYDLNGYVDLMVVLKDQK
jgi:hypothetical protein